MYLSKKENYDLIKYNRLQSDNPDVMQEDILDSRMEKKHGKI